MHDLVEKLAALIHEQWVEWSRAVAGDVLLVRRAVWERLWVAYEDLPVEQKEFYRERARKVLDVFRRWLEKGYFYDGKDTG